MHPQSDFFVASRDATSNYDNTHLGLIDRLMEHGDRFIPARAFRRGSD
jgi:hypothetical protein